MRLIQKKFRFTGYEDVAEMGRKSVHDDSRFVGPWSFVNEGTHLFFNYKIILTA